jgi:hypothetical protein
MRNRTNDGSELVLRDTLALLEALVHEVQHLPLQRPRQLRHHAGQLVVPAARRADESQEDYVVRVGTDAANSCTEAVCNTSACNKRAAAALGGHTQHTRPEQGAAGQNPGPPLVRRDARLAVETLRTCTLIVKFTVP